MGPPRGLWRKSPSAPELGGVSAGLTVLSEKVPLSLAFCPLWPLASLLVVCAPEMERGPVTCTQAQTVRGAHGLREEPEFVTARAGESVVLRCDVIHPVTGQPPPYVVEWFKFGVPIPIFIKFGYYPPHVDPEYAGRASLHDKASLRLEQVRSEDQGWYECKV
ncbi:IGSF9B isoform 3, partial [Pan troglodytes]